MPPRSRDPATIARMESLQPFLGWLREHLFAAVFVASLVDATGLPFPGRALLVVAGFSATTRHDVALLIATSVVGILDRRSRPLRRRHARRNPTAHALLSPVTRLRAMRRDGPPALQALRPRCALAGPLLHGREALRGDPGRVPGEIRYWRFLALDTVGTVIYATLWIALGAALGPAVLERTGPFARALLLLAPAALFGVIAYRLLRRRRYGPGLARSWSSHR